MENVIDAFKENLVKEVKLDLKRKEIEEEDAKAIILKLNECDTIDELIKVAATKSSYKKTGIKFPFLNHKDCSPKEIVKNEELSFCTDKDALTHTLIVGDNYDALKLLLEKYYGKVDVIYIDPPYGKDSTGKGAKTKYNNDLSREELLSMLYSRLLMAKQLLSEDGVIFCSIDDKNQAYLKCLFDEIFGEENFVENFIWIKNSTKNLSRTSSTNHEYILCYAKNHTVLEKLRLFRVPKPGLKEVYGLLEKAKKRNLSETETELELKKLYKSHPEWKGISQYHRVEIAYQNHDEKIYRVYRLDNISVPKSSGVAKTYDVLHPVLGVPVKVPVSGWCYSETSMQKHLKNNNIFFYPTADKVPQFKRYLETVETDVQKSYIQDFKDGKKELMAIFNTVDVFNNAKPTTLIKSLLRCMKKDALVLDFFAGSGTTGHAVLDLNRELNNKQQFILCTNNEITNIMPNGIAYDVTSERLKRVMTGSSYKGDSNFKWAQKNKPYGDNLNVYNIFDD